MTEFIAYITYTQEIPITIDEEDYDNDDEVFQAAQDEAEMIADETRAAVDIEVSEIEVQEEV